jgi:ectoine hydroxylase-related dioxygenase (phytanoyl-CoA dioxygenase family)
MVAPPVITRHPVYLRLRDEAPNEASAQLEREGWALVAGAFDADEIGALRTEIEAVYASVPADVRNPGLPADQREDFRYEMLNRSAACQRVVADRRLLDVLEPLLGEDCHVIANTAWRNPPRESQHAGGLWHMDAGPHVPRPKDVPWDDRIPYPVFAIGVHVLLQDCPLACGPTEVLPGSHRSGQAPPLERVKDDDLRYDGRDPVALTGRAGDVAFFVSDVWHRRRPTTAHDTGRFFLQVHYGRRDIAQRLRTTREAGQVSPEAAARAEDDRAKTVIGLHPPFFYDG